jgi:hypothetical protein
LIRSSNGGFALIRQRIGINFRRSSGVDRFSTLSGAKNACESAATSLASCGIQQVRPLFCCLAVTILLLVSGCNSPQQASSSGEGWHDFAGTWTAAGNRSIMRMGSNRQAAISTLEGSLVMADSKGVGVGFRSQVVVFNDSATGMIGRAVWTDEHGDQVFSELRGEGTAADNKINGNFVGGTGRYQGATGTYAFSWRFMIENEDGVVQGQSIGLNGRVRVGPLQAAGPGGTHS